MENEIIDQEELLNTCNELKRAISRLSFVGMGVSDGLDAELIKLRSVIKKEGEVKEIKQSIDSISKILRLIDDDGAKESALEKLDVLNILLKKELPTSLRRQLKSVKKKTKTADASIIVRDIADVIDGYIKTLESENIQNKNEQTSKKGFFKNLFSREESSTNDLENGNSVSRIGNDDGQDPESEIDSSSSREVSLPQDIKDSLQHLIEQLASMDGYAEIADLLKIEILKISKIAELSSILEMITKAFVEISNQEHIQFEKFLKTLNTRIIRVNDFINQTLKYSESSQTDSQQLNLDLTSNLGLMKTSLSDSESLDEAKSSIYSHMDTISTQLNDFCEKQESNSKSLVSQMGKLTEQLKATEDEASRLKDDLAEQRVRAQTDPLTNLPNRYSYNERLTQEYNRWRRYRHSLTLVMGDIDFFKKVNDIHGHGFGDKVLKEVAQFLADGVRESDFIARFGGEEFVILLPETGIVDATRAMNKIRSGISKLDIQNEDEVVPITMSFGISEFDKDDTAKSVFERADKALYRAKEKGRNLVCCLRSKQA